jgi:predicted PurR-regulated permease PerM
VTLSTQPEARAYARTRWALLRDRLSTITPEAIGRGVLAAAVVALSVGLAIGSWPALAPFIAGLVIAYAVLPIANRLDRFMPRFLAAVIAELVALAVIVGVLVLVVPPLLRGIVTVALALPTTAQIQAGLVDFEAQLGQLPDPLGGIVLAVATEAAGNLQATMQGLVQGAGAFVASQILGLAGTLSFILGLLVIPVWVLTLVSDERKLKRNVTSMFPAAIRPDMVGLGRIVDRVFGTFLRVQVVLAIVVGFLIWLGLTIAQAMGIAEFRYAVTGATLLGFLQLIPELGYFLGFFPILLVLAIGGPIPALTVVVVYILASQIGNAVVETRVSRGILDVHPALLIPAIVVLTQFGGLWLFAAAPIIVILRDTVRYIAGRLDNPPKPANVLPGERAPVKVATQTAGQPASTPSVYRPATTPPMTAPRPATVATTAATAAIAPRPERSTAT